MKLESAVFAVAGMCFGIILGWVIGTQQARSAVPPPRPRPPPQRQSAQAGGGNTQRQAPALDEAKVQSLTTILQSDPKNASAALQLANTYFDAERWNDAITWYERTVKLEPSNVDANTDLGVAYYYVNRTDEALGHVRAQPQAGPQAHQDAAQQGHRARLRQGGPARPRPPSGRRWSSWRPRAPRARRHAGRSKASPPPPTRRRPAVPRADSDTRAPRPRAVARSWRGRSGASWTASSTPSAACRTAAGKAAARAPVKLVRDPVCGTWVDPGASLAIDTRGMTHYFCSAACRDSFTRSA